MPVTSISNKDRPLLNSVPLGSVGGAHIDVVFVVDASADRVLFDDEVAHVDGVGG